MKQRCMLCISVTANSVTGCLEQISKAAMQGVDIVELRLDYLTAAAEGEEGVSGTHRLVHACAEKGMQTIATYRPKWEGGNYEGEETFRLKTLLEAAQAGADYVDLEYKLGAEAIRNFKASIQAPASCGVIVSDHDYERTPPTSALLDLASSMREECEADVVKIATTATCTKDAFRMLQLARDFGPRTIALAMGEEGLPSRLLAPKYGAFLTFGALTAGSESAPGQPSLSDMTQVYRLKSQGEGTKVFGVIGDPIKHSMSPVIHNAAFEALGVDAVYLPFKVTDIEDYMQTFVEYGLSGCSITIPHKEKVATFCSEVDEVAGKIGAINTIVAAAAVEEATTRPLLQASNTDWVAAISAIENGLGGEGSLNKKQVCILGSGGTARALAFGALARGATVTIANRTLSKAQSLAKELGCTARSLEDLEANCEDGDEEVAAGSVLINTTSVGMSPNVDKAAVSEAVVKRYALVFDAIYNPLQTKLLQMAESQGKIAVSGVEMFIGQAAEQFKQFTGGLNPPVELMREKVMERL
jgi:3-dehydroquinate dehydratase/shikimate dehydrogenase